MSTREGTMNEAEATWLDAIPAIAEAPETGDALAALLGSVGRLAGAAAAAVVLRTPTRLRAAWNCSEPAVQAVLEDEVVGAALAMEHAARDACTLLRPERPLRPDSGGAACPQLLLCPVRAGELEPAELLLFLSDAAAPAAAERQRAAALAALSAMLLERDALAGEVQRARQARDHFLVAMHHELRTPATAVMLEAGMLQSGLLGALPERLHASVTRLEAQVADLVRVVRRVLDLARLEATGELPRDDLVEPREAIIELARRVEPTAARKGIALSLFLPRTLPVLQTDAERFRRVLLYLLANALKYTEQGRVQVRVERSTRMLGAQRRESVLVIRVIDTGRGIPPEELERVFEPFAQVEEGARTDSTARGVGLGLPLARKLARSLGGEVDVESTPGEGTTATFVLPCRHPVVA